MFPGAHFLRLEGLPDLASPSSARDVVGHAGDARPVQGKCRHAGRAGGTTDRRVSPDRLRAIGLGSAGVTPAYWCAAGPRQLVLASGTREGEVENPAAALHRRSRHTRVAAVMASLAIMRRPWVA